MSELTNPSILVTSDSVCTDRLEKETNMSENDAYMAFLQKAVNKTIEKCLSVFRLSMFKETFPVVYAQDPKSLISIHSQFKEQFRSYIQGEIKLLYSEEDLDAAMRRLKTLVDQSQSDIDTQTWRPTCDARTDLRAHTMPLKQKQKQRLEQLHGFLEHKNTCLRQSVESQRRCVQDATRLISEYTEEIEETYKECQRLPREKFKSFIGSDLSDL